jgi:hypothetical protein
LGGLTSLVAGAVLTTALIPQALTGLILALSRGARVAPVTEPLLSLIALRPGRGRSCSCRFAGLLLDLLASGLSGLGSGAGWLRHRRAAAAALPLSGTIAASMLIAGGYRNTRHSQNEHRREGKCHQGLDGPLSCTLHSCPPLTWFPHE